MHHVGHKTLRPDATWSISHNLGVKRSHNWHAYRDNWDLWHQRNTSNHVPVIIRMNSACRAITGPNHREQGHHWPKSQTPWWQYSMDHQGTITGIIHDFLTLLVLTPGYSGRVKSILCLLVIWLNRSHGIDRVPLQWHYNECDGISNHRRLKCLLKRLFRHRSKKTSKLCLTGLCEGNSPGTGEFPAQRASNAENVPIWWCHHAMWILLSSLGINFNNLQC